MIAEDDITGDDEVMEVALDRKLDQQICNAIDTRFLLQLVYHLADDLCILSIIEIFLYHLFRKIDGNCHFLTCADKYII